VMTVSLYRLYFVRVSSFNFLNGVSVEGRAPSRDNTDKWERVKLVHQPGAMTYITRLADSQCGCAAALIAQSARRRLLVLVLVLSLKSCGRRLFNFVHGDRVDNHGI